MSQESRVVLDPAPKGPPLMVIWPNRLTEQDMETFREEIRKALEEGKPLLIEKPGEVFQLIGDRWEKLS